MMNTRVISGLFIAVIFTTITLTCSLSEQECTEKCGCYKTPENCKETESGECDKTERSYMKHDVATPTLINGGKHFKTGDADPEPTPGKVRLYSMKFCPFSQRVRLAASYKNIPHEIVNVNLKEKPEWLFAKNPKGAVPVLELDGKVVTDSAIIADFLDELIPEYPLHPKNPFQKAHERMLVDKWSGKIFGFKSVLTNKEPDHIEAKKKDVKDALEDMNTHLQGNFLGGESPSMLDFMIYPMTEKLLAATSETLTMFEDVVDLKKFPNVEKWMKTMQETSACEATCVPMEKISSYFGTLAHGKPQYDL